ncbi:flagellar basal-body rod protein FlgG [Vibrio crassostreae]|uniref:flagellar basal-body rod protein FlgG n=1 Tax=Vibrio crassostreae TaxID=246167 RepID=UPI001B30A78C|nr:flagellar basal-body rod protein FlgG [Vibrio crassostreae]
MNGSLLTSKTGLQAQELQLQYISNNIANASTASYKASRPEFAALMAVKVREASSSEGSATGGLQVGTGVKAVGMVVDYSQGQPIQTGRELDVMIQGDGFFKVVNEDGDEYYTRKGSFVIDEDGMLSSLSNYTLDPQIEIPEDAETVTFEKDGTVIAKSVDNPEGDEVGQIELYRFINNNGLKQMDDGLYQMTESSGDEIAGDPNDSSFGYLLQGYTEGSNVDTVTEMVNMITAQRGYEMASKTMNASNEMMQSLNNIL